MTKARVPPVHLIQRLMLEHKESEAFSHARAIAASGVSEADLLLGWMYQSGYGVPQDLKEAEAHYLRAASSGLPLGMFYLGWFYATGGDLARSVEWFTRSSESGSPAATYHLGRMHLVGLGVEESREAAVKCFEAAAKQGHLYARRNIIHEMLKGRRGISLIPVGLFKALQLLFAFARMMVKDPESELLLRI